MARQNKKSKSRGRATKRSPRRAASPRKSPVYINNVNRSPTRRATSPLPSPGAPPTAPTERLSRGSARTQKRSPFMRAASPFRRAASSFRGAVSASPFAQYATPAYLQSLATVGAAGLGTALLGGVASDVFKKVQDTPLEKMGTGDSLTAVKGVLKEQLQKPEELKKQFNKFRASNLGGLTPAQLQELVVKVAAFRSRLPPV
jgi:hypothetical protein